MKLTLLVILVLCLVSVALSLPAEDGDIYQDGGHKPYDEQGFIKLKWIKKLFKLG